MRSKPDAMQIELKTQTSQRLNLKLRPAASGMMASKLTNSTKVLPVIINLVCLLLSIRLHPADAFHLTFGSKLVESIQTPEANQQEQLHQYSATNLPLNPPENLIRPIECRNANNHSEVGICMFSIDCMQNKGVPLSICKHNYFVGTCCKLPDHNNFVGIVYDLRETELNGVQRQQVLEARRGSSDALHVFKSSTPADLSTMVSATTTTTTTALTNHTAPASVAASTQDKSSEIKPLAEVASSTLPLVDETNRKYLISSTKLFVETSIAPAPAEPNLVKAPSGETARTAADAAFQQLHQQPSHISFGSIDHLAHNLANNSAYELLAAPTNNATKSISSVSGVNQQQEQSIEPPLTGVVLSSQHEASSSSSISSTHATPPASASTDQEFTLSTGQSSSSPQPEVDPTPPKELVSSPSDHFDLVSPSSSSSSSTTTSSSALSPSSSPLSPTSSSLLPVSTDLTGSSSPSTLHIHETTTPFTSSLSTAILPNISSASHSSGTTLTSTSTTPTPPASSSSTSRPEQVSTSSQQQTLVSTTVTTVAGNSAAPQPQHNHVHRPLPGSPAANLQMASKIVTGNSASNNLIPGLSGLQSAILAHIPFKIASGLSSGLSSYLQAAMKPNGGLSQTSGRPVIASNTATALQYQAHMHNQTGGKPAGPAVRFPLGSTTSTEAPLGAIASASQAQLKRDVVKEAQLVCGKPRVAELTRAGKRMARIVGGNQSTFGQWPWMVSLRQWRKGAFLHKCGAALLNENWAITAAHCVENVKAPDLLLRLGEFDVSNQNEPFPYIERRVKQVVSHPSFDPKTFEYDLALIRFAEPIQYERNIIPVCVPQGNDSYVDRMATVIGWGRLYEDGPLPDVIQHVDVPIITNQECEKMYKSAGFVEEIPDMFICAGISKGGRDSCEGDSGGPLTMVDHDGRSYLVGIISWGIGCALPSQPGVYTRITAFSSWINQMTST